MSNKDDRLSALTNTSGDDEAYGYVFQHGETGLQQVVEVQQVEWGFEKNNPRWQRIGPVYLRPQSADVSDEAKDMHRRAQKAEGAVAAVRNVLDGWEGTLKHYGPQLPTHDLILTTIKRELEKAIARADAPGLLETKVG